MPRRPAPAPSLIADLDRHGYVEEEFFVEGVADAFDPDGTRIATNVPYSTRFLVRRPKDRSAASRTAFLDPLHMIDEMPASWVADEWIMANGHTWVGVSVHSSSFGRAYGFTGGIDAVKASDPVRYASLQLAEFDDPPRLRSYLGPSNTDSFALRWNMAMAHAQGHPIILDVAQILRSDEEVAGPIDRVYACGFSQTANFWRLFLDNGWHERARLDDGKPVIDAYVLIVAGAPNHQPVDAVLVNILSESEVTGTIVQVPATAPPDRVVPRVRGYELPGAPHLMVGPEPSGEADHTHTGEPYLLVVQAIFAALDAWARGGPPMPHAPRIQRDPLSTDGLARDEHGNALGGVRVPWVEAPRAQYLPRCSCGPTSGETVPFDGARLGALYSSDAAHAELWDRAVSRLVEDRLLLPEDADAMRAHRNRSAAVVHDRLDHTIQDT